MWRKLFAMLLIAVMLCSLIACDGASTPTPNGEETSSIIILEEETTAPETEKETEAVTEKPEAEPEKPEAEPEPEPEPKPEPEKPEVEPEKPEPEPEKPELWLNVSTYNIVRCEDQSASSKTTNPDNIVNFIIDYDLDIIGLNEVDINNNRSKGTVGSAYYEDGSHQPRYITNRLIEKTGEQYYWAFAAGLDGYHTAAHAKDGNALYGNAIISKYPILSARSVLMAAHTVNPDNPRTQVGSGNYERRVLLIAEIDVNGQTVTVISTHFGLNVDERQLGVHKLGKELQSIDTPLIFMGDLNCGYDSDIILDLNDMLKPTSTASKPGTFVSSDRRIDYIFTSDDIETKDLAVPKVYYSDHFPVTVKVKLPDAA